MVLLVLLPFLTYSLVRNQFVEVALAVILLSKWRMLAVRPRFWAANLRANSIDLIVGFATVVFMVSSGNDQALLQAFWALLYTGWLIFIKPRSNLMAVAAQAFIGQLYGLTALYLVWLNGPLLGLTLAAGLICYLAARHFFDGFNEPYAKLLAYIWGYVAAAVSWLTGHWLLMYYSVLSQPTILLTTLGYGLAALYYLDHRDRLSKGLRLQFIFIMLAIILVVLSLSDWGDKVV